MRTGAASGYVQVGTDETEAPWTTSDRPRPGDGAAEVDWGVPLDVLGRVVVAGVLGALIGLERERDDHPAGTRTIATVAIGAALFGAVSTRGFEEFVAERSATNVQVDVTRVASQVVVGIGFLGAGLIFRRGGVVQNLTTAATLWATAAIGLMAGVGNVGLAAAVTALVVVVLVVAPIPQRWFLRRWGTQRRSVRVVLVAGTAPTAVRDRVEAHDHLTVTRWRVEKHDGALVVEARLRASAGGDLEEAVADLAGAPEVQDLRDSS